MTCNVSSSGLPVVAPFIVLAGIKNVTCARSRDSNLQSKMADIDYDKLAAAILRQQKQQQQQQAESEISTRNAGKSSLNDILTSSRRQSIDLD